MNRDDIIRMAREAGFYVDEDGEILEGDGWHTQTLFIEHFANLVAAAEREKVAHWMIKRGYATGHGETMEDLLAELDWQIVDNWTRAMMNGVLTEREACAALCDKISDEDGFEGGYADRCAFAIRERGAP